MNFEFSAPNLQELESIIASLIVDAKCACHIINPHKTRILLWKEVKDNKEIYHLRIGIQKFISQDCLDRNGETYWKFDLPVKREEQAAVNKKQELPTPELDPITKFNQRQEQAHAQQSNSEQSVNSTTS